MSDKILYSNAKMVGTTKLQIPCRDNFWVHQFSGVGNLSHCHTKMKHMVLKCDRVIAEVLKNMPVLKQLSIFIKTRFKFKGWALGATSLQLFATRFSDVLTPAFVSVAQYQYYCAYSMLLMMKYIAQDQIKHAFLFWWGLMEVTWILFFHFSTMHIRPGVFTYILMQKQIICIVSQKQFFTVV